MDISVVIVSFHSHHLIRKIIKIIGKKIPVVIIENSRNQKLKKDLEKKYKNLNVIIPKKNLGFGSGFNLGIKTCKTNYVLHLSPDVSISKKKHLDIYHFITKVDETYTLAYINQIIKNCIKQKINLL